jgi:hypothetical protein
MKNILEMAKAKSAEQPNWIAKAKDIQEIAIAKRTEETQRKYEKLERLDLRKVEGSEEEPATFLVKCITERHSVKTDRMARPMNCFDVEVLQSTVASVKPAKYCVWENTTVLASEMEAYAQKYGDKGSILGKTFILAFYGTVESKKYKGKQVYLFRVIPYEDAS